MRALVVLRERDDTVEIAKQLIVRLKQTAEILFGGEHGELLRLIAHDRAVEAVKGLQVSDIALLCTYELLDFLASSDRTSRGCWIIERCI